MVVKDTYNRTILWATELTNPDILGKAPDFSRFHGVVTGKDSGAVDVAIKQASVCIDDYFRSTFDSVDKSASNKNALHAQEEPQAVEMRRTLAWAINNLRMKVYQLKAFCEKKDWNNDICYDIEDGISKLGECLAQLTIWDEEKYE